MTDEHRYCYQDWHRCDGGGPGEYYRYESAQPDYRAKYDRTRQATSTSTMEGGEMPTAIAPAQMTTEEARTLTDSIKSATEYLWQLLLNAHEGRAWAALGYESWRAWATAELDASQSRAYQMLDQARVISALAEASGSSTIVEIAEYDARRLKPHLVEAVEDVQELVFEGMAPALAVEAVVEKYTLAPLMTSATAEWYTPPEIVERVREVLGCIELDPCSSAEAQRIVIANGYFTREDDALNREWGGSVYMNPPYGDEIVAWVGKLAEEHDSGNVPEAIALVPARVDTQWWDVLSVYPVCFVRGRLKFSGSVTSAPFPSAVVYLGQNKRKFRKVFGGVGHLYEPA